MDLESDEPIIPLAPIYFDYSSDHVEADSCLRIFSRIGKSMRDLHWGLGSFGGIYRATPAWRIERRCYAPPQTGYSAQESLWFVYLETSSGEFYVGFRMGSYLMSGTPPPKKMSKIKKRLCCSRIYSFGPLGTTCIPSFGQAQRTEARIERLFKIPNWAPKLQGCGFGAVPTTRKGQGLIAVSS